MTPPIYIVAKTDRHGVDRWPVAYAASEEEAQAFVAKAEAAQRSNSGPGTPEFEFYVDGPILEVRDPDAAQVAAGLVRAVPGDGYKGAPGEWEADLIARGLWNGREPASLNDLWLSEDDRRSVTNMAWVRWNDRDARYPPIPGADAARAKAQDGTPDGK